MSNFEGHAEVKVIEHVINCDADPFVPEGWRVEEHQKGGPFKWDPKAVQLYLSEPQRKCKSIEGNNLRTELAGKPVLNANVLDYLLGHSHLIPEEWKKRMNICFWGSIYRHGPFYGLCVRCLHWQGSRWVWVYMWLVSDWGVSSPAALRAH